MNKNSALLYTSFISGLIIISVTTKIMLDIFVFGEPPRDLIYTFLLIQMIVLNLILAILLYLIFRIEDINPSVKSKPTKIKLDKPQLTTKKSQKPNPKQPQKKLKKIVKVSKKEEKEEEESEFAKDWKKMEREAKKLK